MSRAVDGEYPTALSKEMAVIDSLARTYGQLPSVVRREMTAYDYAAFTQTNLIAKQAEILSEANNGNS